MHRPASIGLLARRSPAISPLQAVHGRTEGAATGANMPGIRCLSEKAVNKLEAGVGGGADAARLSRRDPRHPPSPHGDGKAPHGRRLPGVGSDARRGIACRVHWRFRRGQRDLQSRTRRRRRRGGGRRRPGRGRCGPEGRPRRRRGTRSSCRSGCRGRRGRLAPSRVNECALGRTGRGQVCSHTLTQRGATASSYNEAPPRAHTTRRHRGARAGMLTHAHTTRRHRELTQRGATGGRGQVCSHTNRPTGREAYTLFRLVRVHIFGDTRPRTRPHARIGTGQAAGKRQVCTWICSRRVCGARTRQNARTHARTHAT